MIDTTHLHKKTTLKAFTLVEMLIVVVIIGILAAALIPRLIGAQAGARDTARKTGVSQIATAIESYQIAKATYPDNATYLGCMKGDKDTPTPRYNLLVVGGELKEMPKDPQPGRQSNLAGDSVCDNYYGYAALKKNTLQNQAFVVVANVEKNQFANISGQDKELNANKAVKDIKVCEGITINAAKDAALNNCFIKSADNVDHSYYGYFSAN